MRKNSPSSPDDDEDGNSSTSHSSSGSLFASDDKVSPLDGAYKKKKIACESGGSVHHVSREAFRRASLSADALKTSASEAPVIEPRQKESRVMVLYSGGTIGMKAIRHGTNLPEPNYLPKTIRSLPHLHDQNYADTYFSELKIKPYVLPPVKDEERRILYWLFVYDPLVDSSNMTFDDWIKIAKDIYRSYDEYDGFVILHGTDTLSYTASALSFLFENLGKPIILTGSQIPMTEVRSDGRKNFVGALIFAGNYDIPEVSIYVNDKLYRGNRASKCDNSSLDCFQSPNMTHLASVGIHIHVNWNAIYRSSVPKRVTVHSNLDRQVGILRLFPSITIECVKVFFDSSLRGVVLQSFGAGNIPSHRSDILDEIKKAVDRGVLVVNCSQCYRGAVDSRYFTGKILHDMGVVFGSDMTPEAALLKLSYILAHENLTLEKKKELMQTNLRGELTEHCGRHMSLSDSDLLRRVAKMLHLSTSEEIASLRDAFFPPLVLTAASMGDVELLKQLKAKGAVLHHRNFEKRTSLHVAAASGHVDAVVYLLSEGVSVHAKDANDFTPLIDAVKNRHFEIIRLLKDTGAHLKLQSAVLGAEMCSCAAQCDLETLKAWKLAGADMNTSDYDGRTPLHVAVMKGIYEIAEYLLSNGAKTNVVDSFGFTPLSHAVKQSSEAFVKLLKQYN